MSTKKKPEPFKYTPVAAVKMQEQAKTKQEFKNLVAKHNERLDYEAGLGIHVNVVNTVGDRAVMPVEEFRRKYLVTIDPRPDATNVFVAMDALTGSVYRRTNGNPEELVEYVEVNINAKEPVFTTDLEKTLAKAATDFANGDESALNKLEENAEQLVKEAVAQEGSQRGLTSATIPIDDSPIQFATVAATKSEILKKYGLEENDISEDRWTHVPGPSEILGTKHLDEKGQKIMAACDEFQNRLKGAKKIAEDLTMSGIPVTIGEDGGPVIRGGVALEGNVKVYDQANSVLSTPANVAFTGEEGVHDTGLKSSPSEGRYYQEAITEGADLLPQSADDAPADDESFSLPG